MGKIALEEHVTTAKANQYWDSTGEAERNGRDYMTDVDARLLEVDDRLELMDKFDIDYSLLSQTSPGAQGIGNPSTSTQVARDCNDEIHERFVGRRPDRLGFFATVALQDPDAAADELRRAVRELGAAGALVNGYSDLESGEVSYLDEERNAPFWAAVAELEVPVYLHPREPVPDAHRIYRGYDSLVGSAWGFGHETGTHAVRLMLSGLFDTYPGIQVFLGHLGEGLPFLLPRLEHRLYRQRHGIGLGAARRRVREYFNENFLVTTSGHFDTPALRYTMATIGTERVLFSVDYPYETMGDAATWFDASDLCDNDRRLIGRENAARVLKLAAPAAAGRSTRS